MTTTKSTNNGKREASRIVATYRYTDARSVLLYEVVRFDPKDFRQRRPDGRGGWIWNLGDVPRVLYRLPELVASAADGRPVFIVEGEKDADNLAAIGVVATTCAMGAGKWRPEYNDSLRGRHVFILPDNDDPGRAHAEAVAEALDGVAASVKVVHLPDLPPKGDVSDWLAAGGTKEQLLELANRGDAWEPPAGDTDEPAPIACYQPFPTDKLPQPIRAYVEQGARAVGCDPAYFALPALAVAAAAIGTTHTIRLRRDWTEPAVLWCVAIGESGSLKSPPHKKAVAAVRHVQARLFREHEAAVAEANKAVLAGEKPKRDKPDHPPPRRVLCADITIEKLADILADNPRGVLVEREELSAWFGSFTRYKSKGAASDVPNWMELHGAGSILYDRKTGDRRTIHILRAAASVCGTVQPGILARALSPEHFEAGLAARLLLAWPPRVRKRWTEVEIHPDTEREYELALDSLLALDFDHDKAGHPVPRCIRLSPEAKAVWVPWYERFAQRQADAEGSVASMLSKIEGYAARLGLVHHLVSAVNVGPTDTAAMIGVDSLHAGIQLAEWFADEAERIYAAFAEVDPSRELVELIRRRDGRITVRELMQANRRYRSKAADAEAALVDLVNAGRARRAMVSPDGAGRPTEVFELL